MTHDLHLDLWPCPASCGHNVLTCKISWSTVISRSKEWKQTDGWTDGCTDRQAGRRMEAIALPPSPMRQVIKCGRLLRHDVVSMHHKPHNAVTAASCARRALATSNWHGGALWWMELLRYITITVPCRSSALSCHPSARAVCSLGLKVVCVHFKHGITCKRRYY